MYEAINTLRCCIVAFISLFALADIPESSIENLKIRANITYEKILPCMKLSWIMGKNDPHKWCLPDDAEEHYREILNKTGPYRSAPIHEYAGYEGPWLENIWISEYMGKPLSYFNGFIPLFIQWIDSQILRGQAFNYIHNELLHLLRKDVVYLAISQGDVGLGKIGMAHPNIFVLSAGGFGHVPLPLIKSEIAWTQAPANYSRDLGFFGNMMQSSRPHMMKILKETAEGLGLTFSHGHGPSWKTDMERTKYNLAPRGYGRSSFRYTESVQMGRIPVFLYDDVPWIPYEGTNLSVHTYGFAAGTTPHPNHPGLVELVHQFKNLTDDQYQEKLRLLKNARVHFTYQGLFKQIERFIQDPFGENGGQLRCIKHPRTERCCDKA